jgi:hypothetical protein
MASEKIIRQHDLNSLSRKLKAFSAGLPEQEKGVLDWMLAQTRTATDLELSDSGLEAAAGGAVADNASLSGDSVSWTHTF